MLRLRLASTTSSNVGEIVNPKLGQMSIEGALTRATAYDRCPGQDPDAVLS